MRSLTQIQFDQVDAEYDQSLKQQQESFAEFKQCINNHPRYPAWRLRSKCFDSGLFGSFDSAFKTTSRLLHERDRIPRPFDLSMVKKMYLNCMQHANTLNEMSELVDEKKLSRFVPKDYVDLNPIYLRQLQHCKMLKRKQDVLQEHEQEVEKPKKFGPTR